MTFFFWGNDFLNFIDLNKFNLLFYTYKFLHYHFEPHSTHNYKYICFNNFNLQYVCDCHRENVTFYLLFQIG